MKAINKQVNKTNDLILNHPYKIFIIACETSGDHLGASILSQVKLNLNNNIIVKGIGGSELTKCGLKSLFPITDLAVMGIIEIIPQIPLVLWRLKQTVQAIKDFQPDLIVTIDAPGFNYRIAKKIKILSIPIIHIVAPTVWAWKPKRAKKIAKFLDHLLCLFKFEPPYFIKEGLKATFIGHPLIEKNLSNLDPTSFLNKHHLSQDQLKLVILPGSRKGELDKHLDLFLQVAMNLKQQFPELVLLFPTLRQHQNRIKNALGIYGITGIVSCDPDERMMMMRCGSGALAASGTVTLELALCHTPMVVAYRINKLTATIVRRMIKTNHVSLVNILYNKNIVPEFLQEKCTYENLVKALESLLTSKSTERNKQLSYLTTIDQLLKPKDRNPSKEAANVIINKLKTIRKFHDN